MSCFKERLKAGTWFGFAEVDIEIPKRLWRKFEEMPPFFYTKQVPDEAVLQHMKAYCHRTGRTRGEGKKLVGALSAPKLLLYAPLLRWYVEHGPAITARLTTRRRKSSHGLSSRSPRPATQVTQTRAKPCSPRCSNCLETVRTGKCWK